MIIFSKKCTFISGIVVGLASASLLVLFVTWWEPNNFWKATAAIGSILAAFGTILAVIVALTQSRNTINYDRKKQRLERETNTAIELIYDIDTASILLKRLGIIVINTHPVNVDVATLLYSNGLNKSLDIRLKLQKLSRSEFLCKDDKKILENHLAEINKSSSEIKLQQAIDKTVEEVKKHLEVVINKNDKITQVCELFKSIK
ncbi:hypothetical protein [Piscirickettsia salmonis]|uniref:hypothetical protein n=1 Tax=Piscirickettsia salmonis TaxID=1238 RepID=UPI0012BA9289|nr:hypothetical protein [Piscirickettsia salmonis]QGP41350.1 hypothetical protein Psal182_03560 [Piscirickettsia salmonis]